MFELERALAQLPREQQQVILLVGLEGMSYQDAAGIFTIPVGTVRLRLSRGRDGSPQAFGYGGTQFFGGSAAGRLMLVAAALGQWIYFTNRRHEPSG